MARNIVILGIVVAAVLAVVMAAPRSKRLTEEVEGNQSDDINKTTNKTVIICNTETACGWTVYTPDNKIFEYFMANDYCHCAPDLVCSYYDDDVSIGAYVHRCQKPLSTTTASSATDSEA